MDKLTMPYREATPAQKLRAYWGDFCDADPVPPEFIDDMEAAGFVSIREVEPRDLEEEPFAFERGIELGGWLWELTLAGRQALQEQTDAR